MTGGVGRPMRVYIRSVFGPMHVPPMPSIAGIPASVLVPAVGIAGLIVGFLWVRRITADDPDPQSFRATADRPPTPGTTSALGLAFLGLAMILAGTLIAWFGATPETDRHVWVPTALLVVGMAFDLAAIVFVAWSRWVRRRI